MTENSPIFTSVFITGHVASALIAALSCIVLYLTLKKLVSNQIAIISTCIFAFATATWSISSQALWQHGIAELLLILMIYLIVRNEEVPSSSNMVGLGLLAGLFIFNRPPDAVLLIPVLGYIIFRYRNRLRYFLAAGIVSGIPFLVYNYCIFGNIFGGYINNLSLFHLDWQFWSSYLALLVSPSRGLFIYSPVLVLSIIGYFRLDTIKNQNIAAMLRWFGPVILFDILVYSLFYDWKGGYCFGPRFLTGMLPVLVIFLAVFLEVFRNSRLSAPKKQCISAFILMLVILSVIIQVIGVFCFPFIIDIDTPPDRIWNIENNQIARSYADGAKNITSVSVLLLPPLPRVLLYSGGNESLTKIYANESEFQNYPKSPPQSDWNYRNSSKEGTVY
ncbi:glycosyltransferase family 39 protein [uncultured Methanoregula sp.]|uniref:glycosyltransferase family 39 protein n=1 Tax=uncultured Methanoregula sp. TaxID=1005933 RepID=UPI002AABD242|nr:glycosyltransferase family 39 protein [uncultured Methanoregula sp.]